MPHVTALRAKHAEARAANKRRAGEGLIRPWVEEPECYHSNQLLESQFVTAIPDQLADALFVVREIHKKTATRLGRRSRVDYCRYVVGLPSFF
jgi:hypothetical protein